MKEGKIYIWIDRENQPRSQGSLLPVPTERGGRENLGTRLREKKISGSILEKSAA